MSRVMRNLVLFILHMRKQSMIGVDELRSKR